MTEQRNLILAIVLSVGIILAFQYFYEIPRLHKAQQAEPGERAAQVEKPEADRPEAARPAPALTSEAIETRLIEQALREAPRLAIDNARLSGSLTLRGARIDDLLLDDYRETIDPDSARIRLLHPVGTARAYFAEFGWVAKDEGVEVPDAKTVWKVEGGPLRPGSEVVLSWDNGSGLRFEKRITLDENYMFTVRERVVNRSDRAVTLYPYGVVSRRGTPKTLGYYILHEGPIGALGERLQEIDYADLRDEGPVELESVGGWLGFTDKYWLVALVPEQKEHITATFRHFTNDGVDRYQTDYIGAPVTVAPGDEATATAHLFAGAKEVELLDHYEETLGIPLFDRAVDFGWFYFLTKPIFYILHTLYKWTGNYGVAILLMTLLVRLALFPLANKSYRAMSRMKQLQPEMAKIRERFEHDKARMNQELMELYKREKVNPMAGCLPIVVQIPVFFALYKVLFVNIEMRHAYFFGWIRDLSAPDPTTVFNLFGLLPWEPPAFLHIGALPLLMGLTMWLQQRLNPQPADPAQARVMMMLPVIFTFLFARFPAGLVLYWAWSNLLSIAQQWVIMRQVQKQPAKAG